MSKAVTRLFNSFQPEHYDLVISLDAEQKICRNTVTIRGKKTGRPSQRLTLHGKYLKIMSAKIVRHDKKQGDQEIAISRINLQKSLDEIRLHTEESLYAGELTITIEYEAPIQASMHGIYFSTYKHEGSEKTLISTQFESHHAREAFPCVDEPEAKAIFDLTLITAEGQTVVANMPATSQKTQSERLVTTFQTSPRMSTYLLAFGVGELQHKTTQTKDGVDVSVYATLAHPAEALDFALETTKRSIEFFNEYYGTPYPLPKCDMMAIPDFSAAAMENWGLVTYREPYLLADPATASISSRQTIATVIAHEISHQWFGNLVTMRWWNDLWLNESFANVMEYVAVDAMFPEWQVFNDFAANEGLSAFRRDSIAGVQSIKTEVRHPDEISTLFDPSIVYAKGGRLLNMLRTYIGEDDFRSGLKQYFAKHQYGNTTGDDLWSALGAASGKDVASFMNPWLEQSGFPLVTVDQQDTKLAISQSHFLTDPAKADDSRLWPVPLLTSSQEVPDLLESKSVDIDLLAADFVRVNQGAVGHYLVRYTNQLQADWLAQQAESHALNEVERLMLLSDSTLLARSGLSSLADSLRLLSHYQHETSEPVWGVMSMVIADARRFIDADPSLEDKIKALIRTLIEDEYQRLGWQEQPNEPSQDTKQRATILGLGTYAEHKQILAEDLDMFAAYKQDASAVPSELRGIVFTAAVRHGQAADFDYLLALEETTSNPDLKQELLGSLSATHDTERAKQLLGRLKDSNKVRLHDIDHWVVLLMRNRYTQQLAWDWLRDNWTWIEKTFEGDKSYDYFPRYAASALNTRQRLQEYREFFEPKVAVPVLTRNITMGIEELENRIGWIERDLTGIQDFFKA
jgi:aminopeptidase N